jgi:hypothetical protein
MRKTVTITLSVADMERLSCVLADTATIMEDDGQGPGPVSEMIWKVQKIVAGA